MFRMEDMASTDAKARDVEVDDSPSRRHYHPCSLEDAVCDAFQSTGVTHDLVKGPA